MIELDANVVAENTCEARVDVDTVCTSPLVPMYEYPCDRSDSLVPFSVVVDSENRPDVNPITDVVELYPVFTVNGKADEPDVDRHVPLIAKHPVVMLKPTFDVDVA